MSNKVRKLLSQLPEARAKYLRPDSNKHKRTNPDQNPPSNFIFDPISENVLYKTHPLALYAHPGLQLLKAKLKPPREQEWTIQGLLEWASY